MERGGRESATHGGLRAQAVRSLVWPVGHPSLLVRVSSSVLTLRTIRLILIPAWRRCSLVSWIHGVVEGSCCAVSRVVVVLVVVKTRIGTASRHEGRSILKCVSGRRVWLGLC